MDPTVRITAQKTFYLLGTGEISEIGFRVHFVKRRARTSPGFVLPLAGSGVRVDLTEFGHPSKPTKLRKEVHNNGYLPTPKNSVSCLAS